MRFLWLIVLVGCGSVERGHGDAGDDAPVCTVHDTVASCGAACIACPTSDRGTPTCNGTACGLTCLEDAPKCSDATCARLRWAFDSSQLDGVTLTMPAGATAAVRNHAGNPAVGVPVTNLEKTEVRLSVPICVTGDLALRTRSLSATIYLEGGTDTSQQYYVQAAVPAPMANAYLAQQAVGANGYFMYSSPISMSQFADHATSVVFQIGSFGATFTGTVWVDDIKIQ